MKIIFITLLLISSSIYSQKNKSEYNIQGIIEGKYDGYLFLTVNNKKDSCLVIDNKFNFIGKTSNDIVHACIFSTKMTSGMEKEVYIENKDIEIVLKIERRKYNETEYDWIIIKNLKGTNTSSIQESYNKFILENKGKKTWQSLNYNKIEEIVSKNPKNHYSGELLYSLVMDSIIDVKLLREIYKKIDTVAQHPTVINNIKEILYPKKNVFIGSLMKDFELPDEDGVLQNTKKFRGNILLIDFWASWCAPCRQQIPKMKDFFEKFKDKNLKILSVSLDADIKKWHLAAEKENITWESVIDINEFDGLVTKAYKIDSIPRLLLIDETGIVIADNQSLEELEKILIEILN